MALFFTKKRNKCTFYPKNKIFHIKYVVLITGDKERRKYVMCKYIIKKKNDIKYYNNGEWVLKDNAEEFDWYNADNTARELQGNGENIVIESK